MTARHLYAIHDFSPQWASIIRDAGVTGWSVITEEIGDDPSRVVYHDYSNLAPYNVTPIVRLNFSHHGKGTIPLPDRYDQFAQTCANFVGGARGCQHWVIGNEPNLRGERFGDIPVTPEQYAQCFAKVRAAIKQRGVQHQVIVGAVAPYNVDTGPWMEYWASVLKAIDALGGADGLALHFYGRSSMPAAITSDAKMDAPFQMYHNGFRAYRDFLSPSVIPAAMRHLSVYGTETDQLNAWRDENTGWVQAAYAEVAAWNDVPGTQKIVCLALYRWSRDDQWFIEGKNGVIADFQAAVGRGYSSPVMGASTTQHTTFIPAAPNQSPTVAAPDLLPSEISADFRRRVPTITLVEPKSGPFYYRLIRAEYVPDGARRFGPDHHILVDVLDESGKREMGAPANFYWGSDMKITPVNKVSEPYGADYGMTSVGHGFGVWVGNFRQNSDDVFGMGLGKIGSEHIADHVSYFLVFQKTKVALPAQPTPQMQPSQVPMLAHPVADPRYRMVTQPYGSSEIDYSVYTVDGVPLSGHNGIDFACPNGTTICAVDDGEVIEHAYDKEGYGEYIKLRHAWGESLYAHLSNAFVALPGIRVGRGQMIGDSGNTGNSTGPHLHFAMRVSPFDRRDGWGGYTDPAPYLSSVGVPTTELTSKQVITKAICLAALEFGVDSDLLLSQAWAESSFNPYAVSSAGAQGLFQFMPATWAEWGPKVGASDPFGVTDSARVGAAYMQWLTRSLGGNVFDALVAYGWGIGNVLGNEPYPTVWTEYANKIIHGRDLLIVVS